jgi:hypothetical protein|tara:strand:- start:41851 stop:42033 length:183 start_codon:yes stop_codon:yes gene_type:complete
VDQARGGAKRKAIDIGPMLTIAQDTPYISNLVTDIEAEMAEREDLEAMVITKRQKNAKSH